MGMGGKSLGKWIGIGWKVGEEFTKSYTDFFKDCRKVGVLMTIERQGVRRTSNNYHLEIKEHVAYNRSENKY
jgi:hypothetical protein